MIKVNSSARPIHFMQNNDSLLLIFVKHPKPGQVKTRLAVDIGDEKAMAIYHRLLMYTRDVADQITADKAIFYGNTIPEHDLWAAMDYPRLQQEGKDLGIRMENAFQWGFSQGYRKIVIIGSDCAELTPDILNHAFDALSDHFAVIGPAKDGGYYLLGMQKLISPVFYHKNWSTDTVFADTIKDLEYGSFSYLTLPILSDIDAVDDLKGTFLESEFL